MEINRNNIFKIVNKWNAKPEKDYGQNFLVEPEISKKIVCLLDIKEDDNVLEIGPGLGSLTHYLCESKAKITAVDIDQRMIDYLKISLHDFSNLTLINNDIRKVDVKQFNKIIANLPYNITAEAIVYLLKNANQAERFVLMCQSETFHHLIDVEGKEYGPTSILLHLVGDIKKAFMVKAGSFYPAPKCSSTIFVVNLNHKVEIFQAIRTYELTKQLFLNRRKTIINNLKNYLGNKEQAIRYLNFLNIDINLRPEQIKPWLFLDLSNLIHKYFCKECFKSSL